MKILTFKGKRRYDIQYQLRFGWYIHSKCNELIRENVYKGKYLKEGFINIDDAYFYNL